MEDGSDKVRKPEENNHESFIRLDQFMKLRGLAQSGGEAKSLIQGGEVIVNGELELRRGRKLKIGDSLQFQGATMIVDW
jgi:ribosome-associated protein